MNQNMTFQYNLALIPELVVERDMSLSSIMDLFSSINPFSDEDVTKEINVNSIRKLEFDDIKDIVVPNVISYTFRPHVLTKLMVSFRHEKFLDKTIDVMEGLNEFINTKIDGDSNKVKYEGDLDKLNDLRESFNKMLQEGLISHSHQGTRTVGDSFSDTHEITNLGNESQAILKGMKELRTIQRKVKDITDSKNKLDKAIFHDQAYISEKNGALLSDNIRHMGKIVSVAGSMFALTFVISQFIDIINEEIRLASRQKIVTEMGSETFIKGFQSNLRQPLLEINIDTSITIRDFVKVGKAASSFIHGLRLESIYITEWNKRDISKYDSIDGSLIASNFTNTKKNIVLFSNMLKDIKVGFEDMASFDVNISYDNKLSTGKFRAVEELSQGGSSDVFVLLRDVETQLKEFKSLLTFDTFIDHIEVTKDPVSSNHELYAAFAIVKALKGLYVLYKHTIEPLDTIFVNVAIEESKK